MSYFYDDNTFYRTVVFHLRPLRHFSSVDSPAYDILRRLGSTCASMWFQSVLRHMDSFPTPPPSSFFFLFFLLKTREMWLGPSPLGTQCSEGRSHGKALQIPNNTCYNLKTRDGNVYIFLKGPGRQSEDLEP